MKRYCQILSGVAWWIFEVDKLPEYSPEIIIMDISDDKYNNVKEGWVFIEETNAFKSPII